MFKFSNPNSNLVLFNFMSYLDFYRSVGFYFQSLELIRLLVILFNFLESKLFL